MVRPFDIASPFLLSDCFSGTAAFSEPETKSIKWVLDTYAKVRWFLDLHSYTGDVLYSWGDDQSQTATPAQNFTNAAFNSVRGITTDTACKQHLGFLFFLAITILAGCSTCLLVVLHTRSAVTNLFTDEEYVKPAEFTTIQTVANRVGSALSAAAGRTYAVIQSSNLYATSGSTTDYAYGRHLKNAALNM